MIAALTTDERTSALVDLPGWSYDEERASLYRLIEVQDFSQAFGLMARIALEAEKTDHHPDWRNVYNRLEIWLTTHDAGNAVSRRDVDMARIINGFCLSSRSLA